jgi:hypothetical protein
LTDWFSNCCRTVVAGLALTLALTQGGAAQELKRRWAGAAQLGEWRRVGYPEGTTPRDGKGIAITIDPANAPHTLRSPRLDIPARELKALRITYTADYKFAGASTFVVGALDDKRDIENVRGCEIVVPVENRTSHTVEVDLRTSACYQPDSTIVRIDVNVDGSSRQARPGTVRIHAIELVGP